jgi:transposase
LGRKLSGLCHWKEGRIRGKVLSRLAQHTRSIVNQYGTGASFEELAEQFGCSWQTIRRFLLANEVPLRPSRCRKLDPVEAEVIKAFTRGAAAPQIAERYGVTTQTVLNFLAVKDLREVRRRSRKAWMDSRQTISTVAS